MQGSQAVAPGVGGQKDATAVQELLMHLVGDEVAAVGVEQVVEQLACPLHLVEVNGGPHDDLVIAARRRQVLIDGGILVAHQIGLKTHAAEESHLGIGATDRAAVQDFGHHGGRCIEGVAGLKVIEVVIEAIAAVLGLEQIGVVTKTTGIQGPTGNEGRGTGLQVVVEVNRSILT